MEGNLVVTPIDPYMLYYKDKSMALERLNLNKDNRNVRI